MLPTYDPIYDCRLSHPSLACCVLCIPGQILLLADPIWDPVTGRSNVDPAIERSETSHGSCHGLIFFFRIWLQTYGIIYDFKHMITHIWIQAYDFRYMITDIWFHIWVPVYDDYPYMSTLTHIWVQVYDDDPYMSICTHIWVQAYDDYPYMSTSIWWLPIYWDTYMSTTHIWVQVYEYYPYMINRHMTAYTYMGSHIWVPIYASAPGIICRTHMIICGGIWFVGIWFCAGIWSHIWVCRHMILIYG